MEVRTQKWEEIHKSNENFTEILWMLQPFYLFYYPVIHVICLSRNQKCFVNLSNMWTGRESQYLPKPHEDFEDSPIQFEMNRFWL